MNDITSPIVHFPNSLVHVIVSDHSSNGKYMHLPPRFTKISQVSTCGPIHVKSISAHKFFMA